MPRAIAQTRQVSALPPWIRSAEEALVRAVTSIRIIALSTPKNLRSELERLERSWGAGNCGAPRFEYLPAASLGELTTALSLLADGLDRQGDLGAIYAARARELAHEAAICEGVGRSA